MIPTLHQKLLTCSLDEEYSNIKGHYMTLQEERWQQAETTEDVINIMWIWNHTGF